jgi:murein DD-endopeptidase MepM/ murein hydrolase activator NlpD
VIAALRPFALVLSFLLPLGGAAGAPATPASPSSPGAPRLKNAALASPMPKGWLGGWGGDTGLDIAGDHLEVFALAAGTLDYSEWGHTRWTTGKDTAFSVRLALDEPIVWNGPGEHQGRRITHAYYTHMSKVDTLQREGSEAKKHVAAGERIGVSGIGNGTPHLHLGLLLDNQVEQDSWTFILREHEVRKVLGDYKNGTLLP